MLDKLYSWGPLNPLFRKLGLGDAEALGRFIAQFLRFCLVGAMNTVVHLAVYYLLLHFGLHYTLCNVVAFLISVVNAYFWSSRFVFKRSGGEVKTATRRVARVYIVYGATLALSTALLALWVDVLGISDKLGPIINLFITTPINFLLNRFWAFKD